MLGLKQFIAGLDGEDPANSPDGVARATIFGLEVAAVMLPSEVLAEDRVSRMNELWDLRGEREALVIAVSGRREW